jgi:hypothetical protein
VRHKQARGDGISVTHHGKGASLAASSYTEYTSGYLDGYRFDVAGVEALRTGRSCAPLEKWR